MLRHDIACPFCGLCCDDLTIKSEPEQLTVEANGCPLSQRGFNQSPHSGDTSHQPRIQGQACSLNEAVTHAADLLRHARLPLFSGLGTDVAQATQRAYTGADHIEFEGAVRRGDIAAGAA